MIFSETPIAGVVVLDVQRIEDERGFFGRVWCQEEMRQHGIDPQVAQVNTARNLRKGTVRGMHYQADPHAETKVVRCTRGSVFDVAVDLRPSSPTRKQWVGVELSADNGRMLVIPPGCAHGYQTLEDGTDLMYLTSAMYARAAATGVRHDDPAFGIRWPLPVAVLSSADASWPRLEG
jgi:dTDP-4-dehydrorhamnose 3,5-epimerase